MVSDNGAKGLGGPPYQYSDLGTVTKGFNVVQKLMTFAPGVRRPADAPALHVHGDDHGVVTASSRSAASPSVSCCTAMPAR